MRRACRPSPAWLRWAVPVCALLLLAPRPAAAGQCDGPDFGVSPFPPALAEETAWGTVVGDFYGPGGILDGKPDVVVTRDDLLTPPGKVRLFTGDGTGKLTFLLEVDAGLAPRDLLAADLDRDGFLDLAFIPTGETNTVRFLRGDGGGFISPIDLSAPNPTRLVTGDFDRDGLLDLVVLNGTDGAIAVFRGDGAFGFVLFASQPTIPGAPGPLPTAAVAEDFDRDGNLDLAVTVDDSGVGSVLIYRGDGAGLLGGGIPATDPFSTASVGAGPADIVAGDVLRDGTIDLVTADHDAASATVLSGDGTGLFASFQVVTNGLTEPRRVALEDFDRDGVLDLAVLNETGAPPTVVVFPGSDILPAFDEGAFTSVDLVQPQDLALGDLDGDGRVDLVVSDWNAGAAEGEAKWIPNIASPDCSRTSFSDAPRAYPGGNGVVWLAVADLDEDGIDDLVAAASLGGTLELLRGTGNGYAPNGSVTAVAARGVAAADFNVDGHADVVAALGNDVQLFLGDGLGGLTPEPLVNLDPGAFASAVVTADFNGDGAPDVAATGLVSNSIYILLGDGAGGLGGPSPISVGLGPLALATGRLDAGPTIDLVVANSQTDNVTVLLGDGDGTFTPGPTQAMGDGPWGVALADFDGDGNLDLATNNHDGSTVSVRLGTGTGNFGAPLTLPVTGQPFAIAALDVTGDLKNDITVVTSNQTLGLLPGNGDGTFGTEASFPVRTRPSSIAPVDADSDGLLDLAIPCKEADSIVVLLARPPGFASAPAMPTGPDPLGVVNADFDGDGDLDLAVVNSGDGTISIFENDSVGGFTPAATFGAGGANPQSLVVADFDRNGTLDLATTIPGATGNVSVVLSNGTLGFGTPPTPILSPAGSTPDDLVVGDFDRDGAPDLATCNKLNPTGQVTFLRNVGSGSFAMQSSVSVGNAPTAITAGDFDRNGLLDVAVANDDSNNLTVLYNDGTWAFPSSETLPLDAADTSPVSITAGDFDGDGDTDLATVTFISDRLSVFQNLGPVSPFFGALPTPTRFDASYQPLFVTTADVNLDGTLDLVALADGMKVLRGRFGLDFEPSEDVIAGLEPRGLTIGDFNRDGLPDAALVNQTSDDVSILLSSACQSRRLVMGMSPLACGISGPPFPVSATVWVEDDGGNVAVCEAGSVTGGIVPGTGTGGATFLGPNPIPVVLGVADFSSHDIDMAGSRYQLQFDLSGLPPVVSRSFTLGATVGIVGPPSVCPLSSEMYTADPGFDTYTWSVDGVPFDWKRVTTLSQPPLLAGTSYTLSVDARVDGCTPSSAVIVFVGDLAMVDITPTGAVTVCVDCLGGTVFATETGGGAPLGHQWGYRMVSGNPPVIPIPGQTSSQYVINGLDFPGVGDYFLVETTTPTCGGPVTSNEVMVSITAMVPSGEVQSLGATSRGPGGAGENVLQWVNTNGGADENLARWNKAPDGTSVCSPPTSPFAAADGEHVVSNPAASKQSFAHGGVVLDTAYCYSVFVKVSGSYSPGRTVKARAFDTSAGPVRWAYFSGATAVVPPTVSSDGILALSNDQSVHSLGRGIFGGTWPATWTPRRINGVAHSRSPAVPFIAPVAGADVLFFVGDDAGDVTAFNTQTGQVGWGPTLLSSAMVTGAPGGFFVQYGGPADAILVGTRNVSAGPSHFYTLDLGTGAVLLPTFDGTTTTLGLGPVMSTPTLDYATGRAYVTSWRFMGSEPSVWCLQIKPDGTIDPTPVWTGGTPTLGDISASPVLANGRVYVANTAGDIYSLSKVDGTPGPVYPTGDGPVKGFLFPNRATGELFFSTNTMVHSISDDGSGNLTPNWSFDAAGTLEPSIVLHWPNTDLLFVGSKDGTLWQIDFSAAPILTATSQTLGDGVGHIGAPSLDIGLAPPDVSVLGNSLLLVGSESGALYAVEVPLP